MDGREALQVFEEIRRRGLQLYAIIHIAVINTSRRGGMTESALQVFKESTARIPVGVFAYARVISACGKGWMAELASRSLRRCISEGASPM